MSQHDHAITDAALELDPADRLELASLLIDSVEGSEKNEAWAKAWTEELHRRSDAADAREARGELRGKPWGEVRAQILERLARRQ